MVLTNGFTLSAALLLATFSIVCILWTTPLLHPSNAPTELASARSTSVTAASFSKGHATSTPPQRVQELAQKMKPVRVAAVSNEPELSTVARMTNLASEGDLSPTTQNEIDIIENNMNYLRDAMDKVQDQLSSEHDFMQVIVMLMLLVVLHFAVVVVKNADEDCVQCSNSAFAFPSPQSILPRISPRIQSVVNAVGNGGANLQIIPGPRGLSGRPGPAGPTGASGRNGRNGVDGATGPPGPQGPQGVPGKFVRGPRGYVGPTGPQGPRGFIGVDGPRGPRGDVGPKGDRGPIGQTGRDGHAQPLSKSSPAPLPSSPA